MMGLRALASILAVGAVACAPAQRSQPPQEKQLLAAVSPPERLQPTEPLPQATRDWLRERMASHAQRMSALTSAIMVLRYPAIRELAGAIAKDASLEKPLTGDAPVLPAAFFAYHEELRARAGELERAAEQQGAFLVADAYGKLSETCVRCHATYRQGR